MPTRKIREMTIRLNAAESLKMARAILNPREPNHRLREAAKQYLASIKAK